MEFIRPQQPIYWFFDSDHFVNHVSAAFSVVIALGIDRR
jgi:hypothetical protein